MARIYLFADEAGDFVFSRNENASQFFVVCTVTLDSCEVGHQLLDLRRSLAWDGYPVREFFHATTDKQAVRDAVYGLLQQHDFTIQATIMEKSKAQPQVRRSNARFYQYGWYYHFRHGNQRIKNPGSELLITAASVATKRHQHAFTSAVNDVVQQTIRRNEWQTMFCRSMADPCLQVADYCTWAIQRKWERDDTRSYDLVSDRITYEYDLWGRGTVHHY